MPGPALGEGTPWQDGIGTVPEGALGVSDKGRWIRPPEKLRLALSIGMESLAEAQGRSRSWLGR